MNLSVSAAAAQPTQPASSTTRRVVNFYVRYIKRCDTTAAAAGTKALIFSREPFDNDFSLLVR
jgi:hypothetical protein